MSQASLAQALCDVGRRLDARGWCPATSGNLSARLPYGSILVTPSGCHVGSITPDELLVVDEAGQPHDGELRPSAETALHCSIYAAVPAAGAVLHAHSPRATVGSQLLTDRDHLSFTGYELQKAFAGVTTHESTVKIPVFDNTQDMAELSERSRVVLEDAPGVWAYLIRGHGAYAWGSDIAAAYRHLEALETLVSYELIKREVTT